MSGQKWKCIELYSIWFVYYLISSRVWIKGHVRYYTRQGSRVWVTSWFQTSRYRAETFWNGSGGSWRRNFTKKIFAKGDGAMRKSLKTAKIGICLKASQRKSSQNRPKGARLLRFSHGNIPFSEIFFPWNFFSRIPQSHSKRFQVDIWTFEIMRLPTLEILAWCNTGHSFCRIIFFS